MRTDQPTGTDEPTRRHSAELSRQRAAEQLVDIAYALAAGEAFELTAAGGAARLPVPEHVRLERETRSEGDRVALAVVLSWSR